MIKTLDPTYFNLVLNAPEVRAGGENYLDVTEAFATGQIVGYQYDGGCMFFVKKDGGIFEAHTQALKSGRGKPLREFIKKAFHDVFCVERAEFITSFGAHKNPAAQKLASEFLTLERSDEEFNYYKLSKGDWLCRQH